MILCTGPSTKRARWSVDCDVHGHISNQTTHDYARIAAEVHRDAEGCLEPTYLVEKASSGAWIVFLSSGWSIETRSSKALAIRAARQHANGKAGAKSKEV